jgi:hypothetical protein
MNEYLKETELKELFDSLLKVLLSRPDLPYNPYPGFVRRFRVQAEKFHLYEKTHEAIMEILCKCTCSIGSTLHIIIISSECHFSDAFRRNYNNM